MLNKKSVLVAGVAIMGALSLSACATKKYVNAEVLRVDTFAQGTQQELGQTKEQLTATQGQVQNHGTQIAQLDATSRQALERATAAGKLAEGKFMYSVVLSDDGIKFPLASNKLSPEAEERLAQLAQRLKGENKNVYLEIQGHTDGTGSPVGNERLGEARAAAVRKYLSTQGVALSRMATISYGEDAPVAPNNTRAGREQNRRVVVVVLS